jgi:hypothetical protein
MTFWDLSIVKKKLMIRKFFKYVEQWEKYEPSSFWFCTIGLLFIFSFGALSPASEVPCQSQAIVGQLRSGCQQETTSQIVQITAPKVASSTKALKPKVFEAPAPVAGASAERIRFRKSSGSPSGSGNDGFDDNIGTKKWKDWACPKPEDIISNPEFWSNVDDDPEICTDEDDCEDEEIEKLPRRRLLEILPTPTGKLDQQNLENFDFTNKKLQPIVFPSREGTRLSMDHRSLRKAVYSHSPELGLSDLGSRISCPVQTDPTKYQRMD